MRKFDHVNILQLRNDIETLLTKNGNNMSSGINPYILINLNPKLANDIKVTFDLENFDCFKSTDPAYANNYGSLLGYHTLENGLTFLGCAGGGDWEFPVFFIVYLYDNQLRAYVPTKGNFWDRKTKWAYTVDSSTDAKFWKKEYNVDMPVISPDVLYTIPTKELLIEDILSRFAPADAVKIATQQPKNLSDQVEKLVYYGCGDEGYELFRSTCSLAYQMDGLGQSDKAEILVQWAKEQAEASQEWAEDVDDYANGHWGY